MYNMNSGVYVNYDELSSIIEKLKSERQNLSNIFNDIKNNSNDMNSYWIGNTAEHAMQNMKNFTDSFDLICEQVDKYIKYLETVAQAYKTYDDSVERKMQENSSVSAI